MKFEFGEFKTFTVYSLEFKEMYFSFSGSKYEKLKIGIGNLPPI